MIVKRLLQLNLFVSIIIAIAFLLAPKPTLALYGITGDNILYAIAQYFGTTHVAFAILLTFPRKSGHENKGIRV